MATSKKRTSPKNKGRNAPKSLGTVRADRELALLAPAFVDWYDDGSDPELGAEARLVLRVFTTVLGSYFDANPGARATQYAAAPLAFAFNSLAQTTEDDDVLDHGIRSALIFTNFLEETKLWTGTPEELEEVYALFDQVEALSAEGPAILEEHIPDLPDEERLAALSAVPLVRQAEALLRWIGEGKDLDEDLAFTEEDASEAAAALEAADAAAGPGPADDGDAERTYESLAQQHLTVLEVAWLVDIDPDTERVVPGEGAAGFLSGSVEERLAGASAIAAAYYETAVVAFHPDYPVLGQSSELLATTLAAAASPEPPSVERFLAAGDFAPEDAREETASVAAVAFERLREMAAMGLVELDGSIVVPPALVASLADGLADAALDARG